LPPPNYNFLNDVRFGLLALVILLQFSSCTQEEAEVISTDEMQLIRTFVDLDMAGKTTFDNLPLEADWEKARIGGETIEVPLINPVKSFESNLDNFQTRLVIPKADATQYRIISLESNFDHSEYLFTDLIGEERADSWVRWMKMDSDMRSLEVKSYLTISDPNANMPLDCTTVSYFERTCYYNGPSQVYCSDWELVSSYQVCTGEGGGGGGGGGNNYNQDVVENNVTNPCIKAAVDNAVDANFKDEITQLVNEVFGESEDFNIDIVDVNYLADSVDGETWAMPQGNGLLFDIELNQNVLASSSREYITATIFHELLHAYLAYLDIDSHQSGTQHQTMASEYLDRLSDSLTERYNISENDALNLSWGGLSKTSSWNSLSTTKQQDIINTNLQHRSGLKGTKCN
jgi:hypothetical protein